MKLVLHLGLLVVLCLVQSSVQQSCVGLCEQGLIDGAECQCNASCGSHGDCCSDYADICLSCEDRCDIGYYPNNECQCNYECPDHGNCCSDFNDFCDGGSTGGSVSDQDLLDWSAALIQMDTNNCYGEYELDIQGETSSGGSDQSPANLFTTFDEAIWDKNTIFLFRELFDNYDPDTTVAEDHIQQEQAEESAFLDAVMDSECMTSAYNFLNDSGVITGTKDDFRAELETLWFQPYDRDGSAQLLSSSGFEHVFLGELKNGKVSGFHNWLHWYYEEAAGNIDYYGWIEGAQFGSYGGGITNVFTWYGEKKDIGGNFVGTSPECDLALYTVCFKTRVGGQCIVEYEGVQFNIVTYDLRDSNGVHVATSYPDFSP